MKLYKLDGNDISDIAYWIFKRYEYFFLDDFETNGIHGPEDLFLFMRNWHVRNHNRMLKKYGYDCKPIKAEDVGDYNFEHRELNRVDIYKGLYHWLCLSDTEERTRNIIVRRLRNLLNEIAFFIINDTVDYQESEIGLKK